MGVKIRRHQPQFPPGVTLSKQGNTGVHISLCELFLLYTMVAFWFLAACDNIEWMKCVREAWQKLN